MVRFAVVRERRHPSSAEQIADKMVLMDRKGKDLDSRTPLGLHHIQQTTAGSIPMSLASQHVHFSEANDGGAALNANGKISGTHDEAVILRRGEAALKRTASNKQKIQ
jgi:hypothetical protein